MNFEFLNYLEPNPGMSFQELVDVFKQVYPRVEEEKEEEEAQVGVTSLEDVPDAIASEVEETGTSG